MNTPSTQMNARCIQGNLKWEKPHLKGEAYMLCSLFFSYENANTKKEALTMEFPFTLWLKWLQQNLLPLLCYQIPLLDAFLNYGTSTMLNNGALSPPNNPLFNTT
jgi:hypothetical protein